MSAEVAAVVLPLSLPSVTGWTKLKTEWILYLCCQGEGLRAAVGGRLRGSVCERVLERASKKVWTRRGRKGRQGYNTAVQAEGVGGEGRIRREKGRKEATGRGIEGGLAVRVAGVTGSGRGRTVEKVEGGLKVAAEAAYHEMPLHQAKHARLRRLTMAVISQATKQWDLQRSFRWAA